MSEETKNTNGADPTGSVRVDAGVRPLYDRAVEIARREGKVSPMLLQRMLGIGYGRAKALLDDMAADGIIGPPMPNGKPRIALA